MPVIQYQEEDMMEEVHSISWAREPGELVIEFGNEKIVYCEELAGNNSRTSTHFIKEIIEWLKNHPTRLYDEIIDSWEFMNYLAGIILPGICLVKKIGL